MMTMPSSSDALAHSLGHVEQSEVSQIWESLMTTPEWSDLSTQVAAAAKARGIDGEDLQQDFEYQLLKSLRAGLYKPDRPFLHYAARIITNCANKVLTKLYDPESSFSYRGKRDDSDLYDIQDDRPGVEESFQPEVSTETREQQAMVKALVTEILQTLPGDKAEALRLRYLEELPGKEAAAKYGINHNAFRALLYRARLEAKGLFGDQYKRLGL